MLIQARLADGLAPGRNHASQHGGIFDLVEAARRSAHARADETGKARSVWRITDAQLRAAGLKDVGRYRYHHTAWAPLDETRSGFAGFVEPRCRLVGAG